MRSIHVGSKESQVDPCHLAVEEPSARRFRRKQVSDAASACQALRSSQLIHEANFVLQVGILQRSCSKGLCPNLSSQHLPLVVPSFLTARVSAECGTPHRRPWCSRRSRNTPRAVTCNDVGYSSYAQCTAIATAIACNYRMPDGGHLRLLSERREDCAETNNEQHQNREPHRRGAMTAAI